MRRKGMKENRMTRKGNKKIGNHKKKYGIKKMIEKIITEKEMIEKIITEKEKTEKIMTEKGMKEKGMTEKGTT